MEVIAWSGWLTPAKLLLDLEADGGRVKSFIAGFPRHEKIRKPFPKLYEQQGKGLPCQLSAQLD